MVLEQRGEARELSCIHQYYRHTKKSGNVCLSLIPATRHELKLHNLVFQILELWRFFVVSLSEATTSSKVVDLRLEVLVLRFLESAELGKIRLIVSFDVVSLLNVSRKVCPKSRLVDSSCVIFILLELTLDDLCAQ